MILLWGVGSDGCIRSVMEALARAGAPFVLVDQRQMLETRVSLRVEKGRIRGTLSLATAVIDLDSVSGIYLRPYPVAAVATALPQVEVEALSVAAASQSAFATWCDASPALVMNRPSCALTNASKPRQLEFISRCGFKVPETIVTNDPDEALAFWRRHGSVVYKSTSSVRSKVALFTSEHAARAGDVRNCPTQLQEFVQGQDVRVHVVEDEVYSARVESAAVDYRYPAEGEYAARLSETTLPDAVARGCLDLARRLGLVLAGIDLRETPGGDWYCFEVNPGPAFTYYQDGAGVPIGEAISRALMDRELGQRRVGR